MSDASTTLKELNHEQSTYHPAGHPFTGAAYAHDLPASTDTAGHVLVDHPKATTDDKIEKGKGDAYGTILMNTGSHTTHTPGDSHAAEKGEGDSYGSVLIDANKKMKH